MAGQPCRRHSYCPNCHRPACSAYYCPARTALPGYSMYQALPALHHDIAAAQGHAHPHQFFQQADVFVPRAEHILQSPGSRGQFLFLCQRSSPPTPRRANLRRAARRWALRKRAPQSHTRTHHLSYYNLPICQGFRPRSGSLIWQFFPPHPAPDCARR